MRTGAIAGTALLALSLASFASAQNKPKANAVPMGMPDAQLSAEDAQKHFTKDSTTLGDKYTAPKSGDWNAPGALDLHAMTEAQFAAFRRAHPYAVIVGRCFLGEDADPQVRAQLAAARGEYKSCS